jgi:hypothetical protein
MKVSEMDELIFLWKEYGKARDNGLTEDAQELKKKLRKFIQSLPKFEELELECKKKSI